MRQADHVAFLPTLYLPVKGTPPSVFWLTSYVGGIGYHDACVSGLCRSALRTGIFQNFHCLLKLEELALRLPAVALGLRVLSKPLLEVACSGVLRHAVLEAVAGPVHEKVLHLLGNDIKNALAHHIAVGEECQLRKERKEGAGKSKT